VHKPMQLSSLMLPNKWNISSLSRQVVLFNRSRYRHYSLNYRASCTFNSQSFYWEISIIRY